VAAVSGRVREVERLLQLVTVLRAGEGYPVLREVLMERVDAYRTSSADPASVKRMMANDRRRLKDIGFQIDDVAAPGQDSAFLLRDAAWRLPLQLDPLEESFLVWVMAAAGAVVAEAESAEAGNLSDLLGPVPRGLDLAQAAIAGRRKLLIERDGEELTFEPALLASRTGRWFLLGREKLVVMTSGLPLAVLAALPVPGCPHAAVTVRSDASSGVGKSGQGGARRVRSWRRRERLAGPGVPEG